MIQLFGNFRQQFDVNRQKSGEIFNRRIATNPSFFLPVPYSTERNSLAWEASKRASSKGNLLTYSPFSRTETPRSFQEKINTVFSFGTRLFFFFFLHRSGRTSRFLQKRTIHLFLRVRRSQDAPSTFLPSPRHWSRSHKNPFQSSSEITLHHRAIIIKNGRGERKGLNSS